MISVQRHVAEKLVLYFRGHPKGYGFDPEETGGVVFYNTPFSVGGGYLQIFGAMIIVIAMTEIRSFAFVPASMEEMRGKSLIAVE